MKWAHLPMDGGLYAQHPGLMDRFYYILAERAKEQEREHAKQTREKGGVPRGAARSGISRPRRAR